MTHAGALACCLGLALLGCSSPSPAPPPPPPPPLEQEPSRSTPARSIDESPQLASPPCELVDPPPSMVDLAEAVPSAIIQSGYHGAQNFTGARLPGYEASGAWLEREAAAALVEVADALARDRLRLLVYDAYRPRSASEAMVAWAAANEHAWLITDGWVAPKSAHNRGRAIDVGLADEHGVALDMGSAWDQFDETSYLRGVEGPALERRLRLRSAMVFAGFTPYAREWWHFGYDSETSAPALDVPYACR